MNRPGPGARWMGSPSGFASILIACAPVLAGAFSGELPWWLALFALGFVNGTVSARKQLQAYDAWAARWNAMAGTEAPEAQRKQPRAKRNGRLDRLAAVVLLVGLPWLVAHVANTQDEREFLAVLWLVDVSYLVFVAVRAVVRRSRKRIAMKPVERQAPVEDTAVASLVEAPSAAPSREDAERELPEYASLILSASENPEKRP